MIPICYYSCINTFSDTVNFECVIDYVLYIRSNNSRGTKPQMIGQRKIIRYVQIDCLIAMSNFMISMYDFSKHHLNVRAKTIRHNVFLFLGT